MASPPPHHRLPLPSPSSTSLPSPPHPRLPPLRVPFIESFECTFLWPPRNFTLSLLQALLISCMYYCLVQIKFELSKGKTIFPAELFILQIYRNVCFPCEEQCSMYRCTEQTAQHLGTKQLQNIQSFCSQMLYLQIYGIIVIYMYRTAYILAPKLSMLRTLLLSVVFSVDS